MGERVRITVDGRLLEVPAGTTVAAALMQAGVSVFRLSVNGEPRAPLCGMGICMECRVSVDDVAHCRSCQLVCRNGMSVKTK